jgi:choline transport protein
MTYPAMEVPFCMLGSVLLNGVMGFAFMIALLFCMGDIDEGLSSPTGHPFIDMFRGVTKSRVASSVMTLVVIVTALLATIALIASAARMVWSPARDKGEVPSYQTDKCIFI